GRAGCVAPGQCETKAERLALACRGGRHRLNYSAAADRGVAPGLDLELWSDGFDERVADLASGQEQIVIRMRAALNVSLAGIEAARSLREHPANPDAFDFILRARAVSLLPRTKETVAQALGLYEQALARDQSAVLALTGAAFAVLELQFLDVM